LPLIILIAFSASLRAEEPTFEAKLFSSGALIYSDNFDGEFNRKRWGAPKKDKEIKDEKDKLGPRFTFKGGPDCRILFDSVRLLDCGELKSYR
jgi:hypothetical protein|tara:strand:+ start:610 stop:888 length:279 start_codon:yes stop_codon:yes gene_type:complete